MEEKYNLDAFKSYLDHHTPVTTAKDYCRRLRYCIADMGESKTYSAGYQDVLDYIGLLRKRGLCVSTIVAQLSALKRFYEFLVWTDFRSSHPCRRLYLKDHKTTFIQLQNLFTPRELEQLMNRKERYAGLVAVRNKVTMSLLIYQALGVSEITRLTLEDIDLEKGTVFIAQSRQNKSRTLFLKSSQIMLFYKYLFQSRPRLLAVSGLATSHFMISIRGLPEEKSAVSYLVETFRHYFPGRKLTTVTIRQSVIANLLKEGKDIRVVQEFAGHRCLTTTRKYRENGLDELQSVVQKFHPLQ